LIEATAISYVDREGYRERDRKREREKKCRERGYRERDRKREREKKCRERGRDSGVFENRLIYTIRTLDA
jgi:hypothetical protein